MFVRLKEGEQERLIRNSIEKAGAYRKLAKTTGIPRSTICGYLEGKAITEDRFNI